MELKATQQNDQNRFVLIVFMVVPIVVVVEASSQTMPFPFFLYRDYLPQINRKVKENEDEA